MALSCECFGELMSDCANKHFLVAYFKNAYEIDKGQTNVGTFPTTTNNLSSILFHSNLFYYTMLRCWCELSGAKTKIYEKNV